MGPAVAVVAAEGTELVLGDEDVDGDCEGGFVVVGLGLLEGPLGSVDKLGPGDKEGIVADDEGAEDGAPLIVMLLLGDTLDDGRAVADGESDGGTLALGAGLLDGRSDGGDVVVGPGLVVGTTVGVKD